MASIVEYLLNKAADADDENMDDADDDTKVLEWAREVELQWLVKHSSMKEHGTGVLGPEAVDVALDNDKSNSITLTAISSQLQDIRECLHDLGVLSDARAGGGTTRANYWAGVSQSSAGVRANDGAKVSRAASGNNGATDRAKIIRAHNRPRRKCHDKTPAKKKSASRKALTKCTARAPVDSRSKNRTAGAKSIPDKKITAPIKIEPPSPVSGPQRIIISSMAPIPVKRICLRNGTQVKSMVSQIRKCLVNHSSAPRKQ